MNQGILGLLMHILGGGMNQGGQQGGQSSPMGGGQPGPMGGGQTATPQQGQQQQGLGAMGQRQTQPAARAQVPGQNPGAQPPGLGQGGTPIGQGFRGAMLGPMRNPNAGGYAGGGMSEAMNPGMSYRSQISGGTMFGSPTGLGRL